MNGETLKRRGQAVSMRKILGLGKLEWYFRLPVKWAIIATTVLAVCFPHPSLLARHVSRWRDPNALIEPDAASLLPLLAELREKMTSDLAPKEALSTVEKFVYEKIPYEFDWNTWGNVDYIPTVDEAIAMGKEDCDGRAVVAASLLRHFGFETEIVTDFGHVWVKTDKGETMAPGKRPAVVATDGGLSLQPGALAQLPKAFAYGIAPFPLARELIVLAVIWWLLLHRRTSLGAALVTLALLVDGLLFLRAGGKNYWEPVVWMQLVGGANMLAAVFVQFAWVRLVGRTAEAT